MLGFVTSTQPTQFPPRQLIFDQGLTQHNRGINSPISFLWILELRVFRLRPFLWNFFQVGWEAVRSMDSNMTTGNKHHTYSTFRDGILRLIIR